MCGVCACTTAVHIVHVVGSIHVVICSAHRRLFRTHLQFHARVVEQYLGSERQCEFGVAKHLCVILHVLLHLAATTACADHSPE